MLSLPFQAFYQESPGPRFLGVPLGRRVTNPPPGSSPADDLAPAKTGAFFHPCQD